MKRKISLPFNDEFYETQVEPGIRDVLTLLHSYGINTTSSCEGHQIEAYSNDTSHPTISCYPSSRRTMNALHNKIERVLLDHGYRRFGITSSTSVDYEHDPDEQIFVKIEFFDPSPVVPSFEIHEAIAPWRCTLFLRQYTYLSEQPTRMTATNSHTSRCFSRSEVRTWTGVWTHSLSGQR